MLAKSLLNVKVETDLCDWSSDFSNILIGLCADSWTTRHISTFMAKAFQFRKPGPTFQILDTYTKLLNLIESKLAITYTSLSQASYLNEKPIIMPTNSDDLKAVREDLLKIMTQQYIAGCLLGNKAQLDFTISQLMQHNTGH